MYDLFYTLTLIRIFFYFFIISHFLFCIFTSFHIYIYILSPQFSSDQTREEKSYNYLSFHFLKKNHLIFHIFSFLLFPPT